MTSHPEEIRHPAKAGHDLRVEPLRTASHADWENPEVALLQLYRTAEERALSAADWYLADKRSKRRMSRLLRAWAILFAAAGGVYPLIVTGQSLSWSQTWGYVLLALAAACVAFDRFFGLSSAWMRDISSANTINTRLLRFQYDWTMAIAGAAVTGVDDITQRCILLRNFVEDIAEEVNQESGTWKQEFSAQITELDHSAISSARSRAAGDA